MLKSTRPKVRFEVGETIRIPHEVGLLNKGYYSNWKDQLYKITSIKNTFPRKTFKISDEADKEYKRSLYPEEVQKVSENLYRIEKIIRQRKTKGKTEYFVKWLEYSDSYNSWKPAENIKRLKNG